MAEGRGKSPKWMSKENTPKAKPRGCVGSGGSEPVVQGVGGGEQIGGPAGAGAAAHSVDGAGNRHSSHNVPLSITYRCRHTGHTRLTFGHALRPPAPANLKQRPLSEHRVIQQRAL